MVVTSFIPWMTLRWGVNCHPHCKEGNRENLKCPRKELGLEPRLASALGHSPNQRATPSHLWQLLLPGKLVSPAIADHQPLRTKFFCPKVLTLFVLGSNSYLPFQTQI